MAAGSKSKFIMENMIHHVNLTILYYKNRLTFAYILSFPLFVVNVKNNEQIFRWSDGTQTDLTNWARGAPHTSGFNGCGLVKAPNSAGKKIIKKLLKNTLVF